MPWPIRKSVLPDARVAKVVLPAPDTPSNAMLEKNIGIHRVFNLLSIETYVTGPESGPESGPLSPETVPLISNSFSAAVSHAGRDPVVAPVVVLRDLTGGLTGVWHVELAGLG